MPNDRSGSEKENEETSGQEITRSVYLLPKKDLDMRSVYLLPKKEVERHHSHTRSVYLMPGVEAEGSVKSNKDGSPKEKKGKKSGTSSLDRSRERRSKKIHRERTKKKEESEEIRDVLKVDGVQEQSGGKEEEGITKKKEESDEIPSSDAAQKNSEVQDETARKEGLSSNSFRRAIALAGRHREAKRKKKAERERQRKHAGSSVLEEISEVKIHV
ncbi:hypothetical protein Aduo_000576 [Ancylostoma duodenale]